MSKNQSRTIHVAAAAFGLGLLAYLVCRTGPGVLIKQMEEVGWGMGVIILLAGVSHVLKTCAWRFTSSELRHVQFSRTFALRLISEAVGQLGLAGQFAGDTLRVALIGPGVTLPGSISSVTLDRGIFTLSAAVLSIAGIIAAFVLFPVSAPLRWYALSFAFALLCIVVLTVLAVVARWPVFSGLAQLATRVPRLRKWLQGKEQVIDSAEQKLFDFHHDRPAAFWTSVMLNGVCQVLAVLEVYLLLHFLHAPIGFLGAFIMEACVKMLSAVGAVNPGNVGTYEGGHVLITKLFGVTSVTGLALGVCRRLRALFWAGVGAACLAGISKSSKHRTLNPAASENSSPTPQHLSFSRVPQSGSEELA